MDDIKEKMTRGQRERAQVKQKLAAININFEDAQTVPWGWFVKIANKVPPTDVLKGLVKQIKPDISLMDGFGLTLVLAFDACIARMRLVQGQKKSRQSTATIIASDVTKALDQAEELAPDILKLPWTWPQTRTRLQARSALPAHAASYIGRELFILASEQSGNLPIGHALPSAQGLSSNRFQQLPVPGFGENAFRSQANPSPLEPKTPEKGVYFAQTPLLPDSLPSQQLPATASTYEKQRPSYPLSHIQQTTFDASEKIWRTADYKSETFWPTEWSDGTNRPMATCLAFLSSRVEGLAPTFGDHGWLQNFTKLNYKPFATADSRKMIGAYNKLLEFHDPKKQDIIYLYEYLQDVVTMQKTCMLWETADPEKGEEVDTATMTQWPYILAPRATPVSDCIENFLQAPDLIMSGTERRVDTVPDKFFWVLGVTGIQRGLPSSKDPGAFWMKMAFGGNELIFVKWRACICWRESEDQTFEFRVWHKNDEEGVFTVYPVEGMVRRYDCNEDRTDQYFVPSDWWGAKGISSCVLLERVSYTKKQVAATTAGADVPVLDPPWYEA